jgi:hypothetical protein
MNYYDIPHISNSDLTAFKYKLFGLEYSAPKKAFSFGDALHGLLLEPGKYATVPEGVDGKLLSRLCELVRADRICKWYLKFSRKEQVQLFTDLDTGLACKSKLDILYRRHTILDLKTTSARTYAEFIACCQKYDYDRQAAFYLDSIGGKRFIFVGIQKIKPFALFHFEATALPGFVEYGRKKYKALLRKWKQVHTIY